MLPPPSERTVRVRPGGGKNFPSQSDQHSHGRVALAVKPLPSMLNHEQPLELHPVAPTADTPRLSVTCVGGGLVEACAPPGELPTPAELTATTEREWVSLNPND